MDVYRENSMNVYVTNIVEFWLGFSSNKLYLLSGPEIFLPPSPPNWIFTPFSSQIKSYKYPLPPDQIRYDTPAPNWILIVIWILFAPLQLNFAYATD